MLHAGLCVVVLIRCLMRSRVGCDVVWLYGLLFVFVLSSVCALFTCVNVMVVACVYLRFIVYCCMACLLCVMVLV